jgi:hypothetical protein
VIIPDNSYRKHLARSATIKLTTTRFRVAVGPQADTRKNEWLTNLYQSLHATRTQQSSSFSVHGVGKFKMENEALIDDQEPGQTVVDKISDVGFTDGIEIRQIIELLEVQNNGGINGAISKTEANTAAMMLRNSLITRLVLLVSRIYAPAREHDLHVGRAFELLRDSAVRAEIETRGSPGSLDEALETWPKLKADHRLPKLKQFRDKYTAHLGKRPVSPSRTLSSPYRPRLSPSRPGRPADSRTDKDAPCICDRRNDAPDRSPIRSKWPTPNWRCSGRSR